MVASNRYAGVLRLSATLLALSGAALALTACTSTTHSAATPTATATPRHTSTSTPTPVPTPTSTTSGGGTAVTLTCAQILTADQLYAFNPNYGSDPGYAAAAGTLEGTIVADHGVACGWMNQTSGEVIQVAIGEPTPSDMTGLKNAAITTSRPVPTYGVPPTVEGYFTLHSTVGEVQVFTGKYWIVATSTAFAEPGDPAPIIQSIEQNLAAG